ncbi:unnamed protein product [Tenebrio molitor]|nr:unnamed protein product [Tenebrio molitor]
MLNKQSKKNCPYNIQKMQTRIRWFPCEKCNFKTKFERSLKRHKKILSHVQRKSGEEIELFYCFNCEYKLMRLY